MKPCYQHTLPLCLRVLFFALLAAAAPAQAITWHWQQPVPTGNPLHAVWGSGALDLFVGGVGTILHYDGATWSEMESGLDQYSSCTAIWGSGPGDVFAAAGSQLLHYDGNGWTAMDAPIDVDWGISGIWGSGPDDVYAVGGGSQLLHYDGTAWSAMTFGYSANLQGIWGTSATNVYAFGGSKAWGESGLYRFNGETWSVVTGVPAGIGLTAMWGAGADDIYVVANGGGYSDPAPAILHFDGTAWTPLFEEAMAGMANVDYLHGVWGGGAQDLYVLASSNVNGAQATLLHLDGSGLLPVAIPRVNVLAGIWGSSATDIFIVGGQAENAIDKWGGAILHFNGQEWSALHSALTATENDSVSEIRGIAGTGPDAAFAVSDGGASYGALLRYDGNSWQRVGSGTTQDLRNVWCGENGSLYAVGKAGAAVVYTGGYAGIDLKTGSTETLNDLWLSPAGHMVVVGDNGTILRYDGQAWTPMVSGNPGDLHGIWASSEQEMFVVGNDGAASVGSGGQGVVLHYDGGSWQTQTLAEAQRVYDIWGMAADDLYAVGQGAAFNGVVFHFDGEAWSTMWTPSVSTLTKVWGNGPANIYALSNFELIHYDGVEWHKEELQSSFSLLGLGGGEQGALYVTAHQEAFSASGQGFSSLGSGGGGLEAICTTTAGEVVGVGNHGRVAKYDGVHWQELGSRARPQAIWAAPGGELVAVGRDGYIARFAAASPWGVRMDGVTTANLEAVWGSGADDIYAVGTGSSGTDPYNSVDQGVILHYNGQSWSEVYSGDNEGLSAIWGSGTDDLFVAGRGEVVDSFGNMTGSTAPLILHYNGQGWTTVYHQAGSGYDPGCTGLWGSGPDSVFATTLGGNVLHYDGASWSAMSMPVNEWGSKLVPSLSAIWGSSASDLVAVGEQGAILRYNGSSWTPMASGSYFDLYGVWGSGPEDLFAVGEHGAILHYGEAGFTCSVTPGWNLLSTTVGFKATALLSAAAKYTSVWKWVNGTWAVYLPGEESPGAYAAAKGFAPLTTIAPGEGFWVNASSAASVTIPGTPVHGALSFDNGWSLVGLKSAVPIGVSEVTAGNAAIVSLWKWVNGTWAVSLPGVADKGAAYALSKGFGQFTTIAPGEGFWVNMP